MGKKHDVIDANVTGSEPPEAFIAVPTSARTPRAKLTKREAVVAIFRVLDRLDDGVTADVVLAQVEGLR